MNQNSFCNRFSQDVPSAVSFIKNISLAAMLLYLFIACIKKDKELKPDPLLKPTVDFSYSTSNAGLLPATVNFTAEVKNANQYSWDFGDGHTSTLANPSNIYNQARNYTIKLVATNPAGSDSITKTVTVNPIMKSVVVYLITPRDKKFNQRYYDILKSTVLDLQAWYKLQLGNNKTFVTNPMILDTLTGLHDSVWYNSPGPNSGDNPRFYGYQNTFYEMTQLLGSNFNTTNYVYFVYVAAPGGGAGSTGFCAMGDQDLKGLLGENPEWWDHKRWIGGGGHELGHALGLPHPVNENTQALMWSGYSLYPNCILQQQDKDLLNASPFIR
ncbi:PKD domain-containing protein [Niabella hirudinis]|uniref:PKD domain-containing protein n=1 Tax=Niabella hirudinis TaxID=1285929 RepID=UPI003EBA5AC8